MSTATRWCLRIVSVLWLVCLMALITACGGGDPTADAPLPTKGTPTPTCATDTRICA